MQPTVTRESTRTLVIANVVTMALALVFEWPLGLLLWPYWIQSIVIGYFSRARILALTRFSTVGLKINGRSVEPTDATRRSTANFFALHYGGFHLGYLLFIATRATELSRLDWIGILIAGASFAWNHRQSFHQNIEGDAAGTPNIGTLMFLPYLRIIPMHLTILAGAALGEGYSAIGVVVFSLLKTAADVGMHWAEHRLLQRRSAPMTVVAAAPASPGDAAVK